MSRASPPRTANGSPPGTAAAPLCRRGRRALSDRPSLDPRCGGTGPQAQVLQFPLQLGAAWGSQTIQLLVARGVGGRGSIDPAVLEQSPERSVHRARAQADAALAQSLDVLHQPVPVAGLPGKTQEDPEGGLAERLDPCRIAARDDVSNGDILCMPQEGVNRTGILDERQRVG